MQFEKVDTIIDLFLDNFDKYFGNRFGTYHIYDTVDVPNHREFKVDFIAYDYLPAMLVYDNGCFGVSVELGKSSIVLKTSAEWFSEIDFDIFLEELKNELELRIPDKFLKSRGWL